MKNKNSVPIIQKLFGISILALTVILFVILRTEKIENSIKTSTELTHSLESLLSDSLIYLYNTDDLLSSSCDLIHPDFKNDLLQKFSKPNSVLKDSNLKLKGVNLTQSKLYITKKKSEKYLIYDGTVEMQWMSSLYNVDTDTESKYISGCIIQNDSGLYLVDITLKNKVD